MIPLTELKNHRIGILGFGQEGQAVLKYLRKHNLTATVFDQTTFEEWEFEIKTLAEQADANVISGPQYLDSISQCTLLFRSPGIWRKHPKILEAEQNGTIISSQTKWFFDHSPAPIVGITGTKGKGTTSSLLAEILKTAGKTYYLTGNIGKTQPLEFLDDLTPKEWIVFELSSFQLQDLTISPHIGICLMTTSDHLNHHESLAEYHEAKSAISAFQGPHDFSIYNSDYAATVVIGQKGKGKKLTVSAKAEPEAGAFIKGESVVITGITREPVTVDCLNRKLRGRHNMENIAAAALAATVIGIELDVTTIALNNFKGLEHRLEFVTKTNGVAYYNDSISTVPETTLAAIASFTEPIHLLLGGSDKGLSYDEMVKKINEKNNIASITFLGKIGLELKKQFEAAETTIKLLGPYTQLPEAMKDIQELAKPGDVVLLSPASASFDMFANYADRGRKFVQLVNQQITSKA